MKTKGILIAAALLLLVTVSSCIGALFSGDAFSSVEDLYGTEWIYKGDGTLGLKFYSGGQVTCFLDNSYGIETISGTYEYIASTKTLSFKNLTWYSAKTMKATMIINGAHIKDGRTMEVIARFPEDGGVTESVLFYKQ
ncbi:MAG: hypothetical protein J6Y45_06255 [Bacteroidales bacterium]|nr:hypothetical protein [Bacteroidales bacterium]